MTPHRTPLKIGPIASVSGEIARRVLATLVGPETAPWGRSWRTRATANRYQGLGDVLVDHRRHAPSARRLAITAADRPRVAPAAYRGRAQRSLRHIYESDHAESAPGGRFRWLISTCIAAAVGAIAIFVVVYGSADRSEQSSGLLPSLQHMRETSVPKPATPAPGGDGGLKWSAPKTDRLQTTAGAASTRFIIHESLKQRRNGREYILAKPYVRIVARLASVPASYADVIPPFNPYKLYNSGQRAVASEDEGETRAPQRSDPSNDVSVKVVELLGGILPGEDGQELDNQEVSDIVERSLDSASGVKDEATAQPAPVPQRAAAQPVPPNTTVLVKATSEADDAVEDLEHREIRVVKTGRGDTLIKILERAGAESWLSRTMAEAAKTALPEALDTLAPGSEVQISLVASLTDQTRMEPARFTLWGEGHVHKVTVYRNPSGDFVGSATPVEDPGAEAAASGADADKGQNSSLYAAVYAAGLMQNVPSETIQQILRVHASDTDFRRRVRTGDTLELFFDAKDEGATDGSPGELLYSAITSGGETTHYYRFRTPDGLVDYYDDAGNNSKKFLLRKPVRGDEVRFTSGFGMRRHPLLHILRPHTGIDWSGPTGTPIIAAGNGTIEFSGRRGDYGNFISIRHANGYTTHYAHMSRFAPGMSAGTKVRQGQLIGYVGTTGLSTGAHLHFEVLINNRFVDPLSIQVPRERQLTGRQLVDYQKERSRIEDLMHRSPVLAQSK